MKICQNGIIKAISNKEMIIKITRKDACDTCRIKEYCHPSSQQEQLIKLKCSDTRRWHAGDKVEVAISEKSLLKSVVWCYILPLILLVATIVITKMNKLSDIVSCISGIIILIMYYFGVFLSHSFFDNKVDYEIKSVDKVSDDND